MMKIDPCDVKILYLHVINGHHTHTLTHRQTDRQTEPGFHADHTSAVAEL